MAGAVVVVRVDALQFAFVNSDHVTQGVYADTHQGVVATQARGDFHTWVKVSINCESGEFFIAKIEPQWNALKRLLASDLIAKPLNVGVIDID